MSGNRFKLFVAAVSALAGTATVSRGVDLSKGPAGADHAAAHARADGTGVAIGILEFADGGLGIINNANNLGARLKNEYDFTNRLPETVGVAPLVGGGAGTGSPHTTLVADIAAGSDATFTGVAKDADLYFGGLGPFTDFANDNSFRAATDYLRRNHNVFVFNLSTRVLTPNGNDNGTNVSARFVDFYTRTKNVLFVKSAGNRGNDFFAGNGVEDDQLTNPGDAFNILTVGAADVNFTARADYSSYHMTGDNGANRDRRGSPHILAPGSDIYDGHIEYQANGTATIHQAVTPTAHPFNDGTSFAAPHVTGTIALLQEKGLSLGIANASHLAHKAIIMNSARKRFITQTPGDVTTSRDHANTGNQASDGNYLTAGGALVTDLDDTTAAKTRDWTPTRWSTTGNRILRVSNPLDDEQGTGMLDVDRALRQLEGGEQEEKLQNPGGVGPIGWNVEPLAVNLPDDVYEFNFAIPAGSFITATLVWDRVLNESDGDNVLESSDTYTDDPFGIVPDFDLFIFKGNELLAHSNNTPSGLDSENVEHLHYPVPEAGLPFEYSIHVDLRNVTNGDPNRFYDYSLAWWTVPEPGSLTLLALAGCLGLYVNPSKMRAVTSLVDVLTFACR